MRTLLSFTMLLLSGSMARAENTIPFEQALGALRSQVLGTKAEQIKVRTLSDAAEISAMADEAEHLLSQTGLLREHLGELRRRAQWAAALSVDGRPPGQPQQPRPQPPHPRPQPPQPRPPHPRPQPPQPQPPHPRPQPPQPQPPHPRPQPPQPQPPHPRPQPPQPRPPHPRPQPPQPRPPHPRPQPPQPRPPYPRNPDYPRRHPGPYPYPYPGCPDPRYPCGNPRTPNRDPWLRSDVQQFVRELVDLRYYAEDLENRAARAAHEARQDPALVEPARRLLQAARLLAEETRSLEFDARFAESDFRRVWLDNEGREIQDASRELSFTADNMESWSDELLKKVS